MSVIFSRKAGFIASAHALPLMLLLLFYFLSDSLVIFFPIPAISVTALYILVFCDNNIVRLISRSLLIVPFLTFLLWAVIINFNPLEDESTIGVLLVACFLLFMCSIVFYPFFRLWVKFLYSRFYD